MKKSQPQPSTCPLIGNDLAELLLLGYRIVWYRWDGWDWHMLVNQPDKTKITQEHWRWVYLQTLNTSKIEMFKCMIKYNISRYQTVLKQVRSEYYSEMHHKFKLSRETAVN